MEKSAIEILLEDKKKETTTRKSDTRNKIIDNFLDRLKVANEDEREKLEDAAYSFLEEIEKHDTTKRAERKSYIGIFMFMAIIISIALYFLNNLESSLKSKIEEAKEENRLEKEKIIENFNQGLSIYCESDIYRYKIDNKSWLFDVNKFFNEKGEYFYLYECKSY